MTDTTIAIPMNLNPNAEISYAVADAELKALKPNFGQETEATHALMVNEAKMFCTSPEHTEFQGLYANFIKNGSSKYCCIKLLSVAHRAFRNSSQACLLLQQV